VTRILIVEDDSTISKLLSVDLELEGYNVVTAADGVAGLEAAKTLKPDLILLDIGLPKMSGYDVCRSIRRDGTDVPIILLTARGQEAEKVMGLDLGADDYIAKPYGSMELIARVRALLRRQKRHLDKVEDVSFGDIRVNFSRMELTKAGKPVALTDKEMRMLELLVRYKGQVVRREQFLQEIWGYEELPSTRTIDNRVMALRKKLSPENPEAYIVSIHGSGYKFVG